MQQPYFQDGAHYYPLRVYYEDTDAGGVVYHSNYLNFAERARTECLRDMGLHQSEIRKKENFVFVVSKAEISYKQPARLDDSLVVETRLQTIRKARMSMRQIIRKEQVVLADLVIEIAAVSLETFKSIRVPDSFIEICAHYLPFEIIPEENV